MSQTLRDEDVPAIVGMINEIAQSAYGVDEMTEAELRVFLTMPGVDPQRDVRLVRAKGGLAGYADVYDENGWHTRYWSDILVHGKRGNEALAGELVAWCEQRACSDAQSGAFLRSYVPSEWPFVGAALTQRGYEVIRHSYRMLIDLGADELTPAWPDGIRVRSIEPGEERLVYEANEECFADHWEHVEGSFEEWEHWTTKRDTFDPSLWFLAFDGREIAGYSLCRPHEGQKTLGWVDNLGVRRPWRRRGLGEALLEHSFEEFRRRGLASVGLGVDAESLTGATRLYERVGMRVVRRSACYEIQL